MSQLFHQRRSGWRELQRPLKNSIKNRFLRSRLVRSLITSSFDYEPRLQGAVYRSFFRILIRLQPSASAPSHREFSGVHHVAYLIQRLGAARGPCGSRFFFLRWMATCLLE